MKNQATTGNPSTFQELASFLNVLNSNKSSGSPLLKKAESPERIVMHLEKQFSQSQSDAVFYRLVKRQLSLNFS
ncbi:MAG: hypothetical protein IT236_11465 [Bacteroidia bacterium]|nr:hypothetical protein [Bacteroidia bacterium]